MWTQRSVDSFLGLPFNIASYGVLLAIFGRILKKTPRYLTGQLGDTHIYLNHTEQVLEQLSREPLPAPKLWIHPSLRTLEDFENASVSDFELEGYESHAAIKAPMAV
ncbi:Thymidylate synthase [compost metagenome]